MTRHKKELMECARMLKLGNLTEHLEELLHQAQEKQLTYPEFLLACLKIGRASCRERVSSPV